MTDLARPGSCLKLQFFHIGSLDQRTLKLPGGLKLLRYSILGECDGGAAISPSGHRHPSIGEARCRASQQTAARSLRHGDGDDAACSPRGCLATTTGCCAPLLVAAIPGRSSPAHLRSDG